MGMRELQLLRAGRAAAGAAGDHRRDPDRPPSRSSQPRPSPRSWAAADSAATSSTGSPSSRTMPARRRRPPRRAAGPLDRAPVHAARASPRLARASRGRGARPCSSHAAPRRSLDLNGTCYRVVTGLCMHPLVYSRPASGRCCPDGAGASARGGPMRTFRSALSGRRCWRCCSPPARREGVAHHRRRPASRPTSAPPSTEASAGPSLASTLVLGGPPECPERPFCLLGLQDTYGLEFKEFAPLDAGGPLTVQALTGGQIQVGLLFTSDPAIAANGLRPARGRQAAPARRQHHPGRPQGDPGRQPGRRRRPQHGDVAPHPGRADQPQQGGDRRPQVRRRTWPGLDRRAELRLGERRDRRRLSPSARPTSTSRRSSARSSRRSSSRTAPRWSASSSSATARSSSRRSSRVRSTSSPSTPQRRSSSSTVAPARRAPTRPRHRRAGHRARDRRAWPR